MPTEAQAQSENTPPSKDQEVNDDQENAVMSPKLDNDNNSKKLSSSQNNMSRSTRRSSAASSLNTIKRPLWKKNIKILRLNTRFNNNVYIYCLLFIYE